MTLEEINNDQVLLDFYNHLPERHRVAYRNDYKKFAFVAREEVFNFNALYKNRDRDKYLVVDQDHEDTHRWHYEGLKQPHIIVKNKDNGRAHLFWRIDGFICHNGNTPHKLLNLWRDCKTGLNFTLDGDINFSDVYVKNPLSNDFIVITRDDPTPYYLGDFVKDLVFPDNVIKNGRRRIGNKSIYLENVGVGDRNRALFNSLRVFAYRNKCRFLLQGRKAFLGELIFIALQRNDLFASSLPKAEVIDMVKSIVKYVWDRNSKKWLIEPNYKNRGACYQDGLIKADMTIAEKQSIGAEYANALRKSASISAITKAVEELKSAGLRVSVAVVAKMAGMSREAIYKNYMDLVKP